MAHRHPERGGDGAAEPGPATSARVLASWARSADYGVSAEVVDPAYAGTNSPAVRDSLFLTCGAEVLTAMHRTLADEPVSLMLTDVEGLVLSRYSGDTGLLRALDAVHLAPGFSYSERAAGTNGLGLALADRTPTVVRAQEHYSASLRSYTCAAAPVLHPVTGQLEGAVNVTTWARAPEPLLLALAQSAATSTAVLMQSLRGGHTPQPLPGGQVFRLTSGRLEPSAATVPGMSAAWGELTTAAVSALVDGSGVLATGEPGSGRATLLTGALRQVRPRHRILSARCPAPQDVATWLGLWLPELGAPETAVVVCDAHRLPTYAAEQIADRARQVRAGRGGDASLVLTAAGFDDLPAALVPLVQRICPVPPLRDRVADVAPLARYGAARARGRAAALTPAAIRALEDYPWPGNVAELLDVVGTAALRSDPIGAEHLPAQVTAPAIAPSDRRLSRLEVVERDEIVRVLADPTLSIGAAAQELGLSRATLYRRLAHYGIRRSVDGDVDE